MVLYRLFFLIVPGLARGKTVRMVAFIALYVYNIVLSSNEIT